MSIVKCVPVVVAIAICGCGSGNPDTAPATGSVTYNGKPVEGASVQFSPEETGGKGASGKTDASGNFTLTSYEEGDGAVPGKYKVTIYKRDESAVKTAEEEHDAAGGAAADAPSAAPKELLPVKYKKIETSGLTAEVKADTDNTFKFELTD